MKKLTTTGRPFPARPGTIFPPRLERLEDRLPAGAFFGLLGTATGLPLPDFEERAPDDRLAGSNSSLEHFQAAESLPLVQTQLGVPGDQDRPRGSSGETQPLRLFARDDQEMGDALARSLDALLSEAKDEPIQGLSMLQDRLPGQAVFDAFAGAGSTSSGGLAGPQTFAPDVTRSALLAQSSQVVALEPAQAAAEAFRPADDSQTLTSPAPPAAGTRVESIAQIPLSFEANQGQTDAQVQYLSRGSGYSLFLTAGEAVLTLQKPALEGTGPEASALGPPAVLRMAVIGADPSVNAVGREELPGKVNYFYGNDPAKWHTDVSTYARVEYDKVYAGIDLVYYGSQQQLEYDFIVHPGAEPATIALGFSGAERVELSPEGELVLSTPGGEVRQHRPVIYQIVDGVRKEIAGGYVLRAAQTERAGEGVTVGFEVGDYDVSRPLVIDPVLSYSTYLGGSGVDVGMSIAVDSGRNIYVAGETASANFPTTPGSFQPVIRNEFSDVFVAKFSPAGLPVYITYIGSDSQFGDRAHGIAVDAAGNAYVTGRTGEPTELPFPVSTAALLTDFRGGDFDGFVTKLNPAGNALLYSTYLGGSKVGGSGNDACFGIAVDATGHAYVVGGSQAGDFPTTTFAFQPSLLGTDAFITKLNPTGTGLIYSTFLGGSTTQERANAIAIDAAGNAFVTGQTAAEDFPVVDAFQPTLGGGNDAFVAKINPFGSELLYCSYLGGSFNDRGLGIAHSSGGVVYVTGQTASANFPTASALQPAYGGGANDAFLAKVDTGGPGLIFSTFLGGRGEDRGTAVAVGPGDNAYVTGGTSSTDFPTMNALQSVLGGGVDAFVTRLNAAGSALVYSTFLGGAGDENPTAGAGGGGGGADIGSIAVDADGAAYIAGRTDSTNFPVVNPFQPASGGNGDAFVAKISDAPADADLGITMTAAPAVVLTGSNVTYTITLTNNGPAEASSVVVTDTLPAETSFVSCSTAADGVCGGSGNNRTVTFASLPAGATRTITLVAEVNCPVPNGQVFSNTAVVTSNTPDPSLANNSATATATAANPPPVISNVSVDRPVLRPPNHQLVDVEVRYTVSDNCGTPVVTLSVTSNEPEKGIGSGDASPDWIIVDAHHVRLRAERSGQGNGRIYTIFITARDEAGGVSVRTVTVTVPHDRSK